MEKTVFQALIDFRCGISCLSEFSPFHLSAGMSSDFFIPMRMPSWFSIPPCEVLVAIVVDNRGHGFSK
eukprot:4430826-Amphidinium_carterae.1